MPSLAMWIVVTILSFLFLLASPLPSSSCPHPSSIFNQTTTTNGSLLPGIELPTHPNSLDSSNPGCGRHHRDRSPPMATKQPLSLKLQLKRRPHGDSATNMSLVTQKDLSRIHTFRSRRMIAAERENVDAASRPSHGRSLLEGSPSSSARMIMATLESGVSQGSGEYFMDVYMGTPPRRFSLILDTGSDLNWIQCAPCHDCFEQSGPHYDPSLSSSYHNVSCADRRCRLVSRASPCRSPDQTCPYFYWYGDRSNTTGDLALEAFTLNLTATGAALRLDGVLFGCGHWNRGLFHGAAGLLGMGRGPLSFPSQLRKLYDGHTFSYCLVDRNSDASVTSKLLFGEDPGLSSSHHHHHPELQINYTTLVTTSDVDTFYYVRVKGVMVGGKMLENIPSDAWELSPSGGGGGTIVDSGTTLTYFAGAAYEEIKGAFREQVGDRLPLVEDFPVLELCYNVSGVDPGKAVGMPEFAIVFSDGAVWTFPEGNTFIRFDPEDVMCLAMLGIPVTSFNILGNYQQQNFHITYDTKRSRLGFTPMDCALL